MSTGKARCDGGSLTNRRVQPVSESGFVEQVFRVSRIGLKFMAKRVHVDADVVVFAQVCRTPRLS